MTSVEIVMLATISVLVCVLGTLGYHTYRDTRELRIWWEDYRRRMAELDRIARERMSSETSTNQYSESGEVVKQPRAVSHMSSLKQRDNVVFLNTEDEEQ